MILDRGRYNLFLFSFNNETTKANPYLMVNTVPKTTKTIINRETGTIPMLNSIFRVDENTVAKHKIYDNSNAVIAVIAVIALTFLILIFFSAFLEKLTNSIKDCLLMISPFVMTLIRKTTTNIPKDSIISLAVINH